MLFECMNKYNIEQLAKCFNCVVYKFLLRLIYKNNTSTKWWKKITTALNWRLEKELRILGEYALERVYKSQ